jgi:hypothetical protein
VLGFEGCREEGKPVPSLCPRIRLRLTEASLDKEQRLPGEGTLEQVRSDLVALESLGARYALRDTYYGDPEATRTHKHAWSMPATLAEKILDLEHGRLR